MTSRSARMCHVNGIIFMYLLPPMPEPEKSPFWSRAPVLWAIVVVLVALFIRVFFVSSPLASDDATYFELASNLSPDIFDAGTAQLAYRTGMVAPLAVVQAFFGYSVWSYYIFSITFAVGLVLMVYVAMLAASGLNAAVMSALLVASSALVLFKGTNVLPDVPNMCFLLLSFHIFTKVDGTDSRRNLRLLALAAGCGFFAYLVRAPNSVFLIAIPVYEYLVYRSVRRTIYFASFFAGFILVECIFYLIVTGNPLKRIMMVSKGVTLWIKHQQTLSFSEFVFDPFKNMVKYTTGWILLGCAIPATAYVVRQKNNKLMALLSGGLLIFIVYSYTPTSFNPLVRALPLQSRYIIAFTCVLAMIAGHWLAGLPSFSVSRFKLPAASVPAIFGALFVFQMRDLPTLPFTLFFTDDGYYVGDRLVRDYLRENDAPGPVYAYPSSVFRMFSGYSQLDLREHSLAAPPTKGRYYLLHKSRVRQSVGLARVRNEENTVKYGEMFLKRNPAWDYLLETNTIVLLYMSEHQLTARPVMDLIKHDVWHHGDEISRVADNNQIFQIAPSESVLYLSTFSTGFLQPGPAHEMFGALDPSSHYEVEIKYHLEEPLGSLRFFMREYDAEKSIQQLNQPMPSERGSHVFSTSITTKAAYDSFRIFLRIENKTSTNQLRIDSIVVSQLQ